jgi:hypothetical protein
VDLIQTNPAIDRPQLDGIIAVAGFAHQPAPVRLPRVEIRVNAILRDEQTFL